MPENPARGLLPVGIEFGSVEWQEEVERLKPFSPARLRAQNARKVIEAGTVELAWKPCQPEGPGGTRLPGCQKLYVPLGKDAPSEAPYGFVFQLVDKRDGSFAWNMIAYGERHPSNDRTRNVYERAHKRLHGRYPEQ